MNAACKQVITLVAIDDDPAALDLVTEALATEEIQIHTARTSEEGLALVMRHHPEIVLLDLVMPGVIGMELLPKILKACPTTDVILITGHYSTESAVEAIRKGASDYLTKPVEIRVLRERVGTLLAEALQRRRAIQLDGELLKTCQFEGMVGRSPLMLDLFSRMRRIAPHFRTALIVGATGTGKELVARALHRLSPDRSGRLVICNCAAIVETLFESELFGHVKGAFTGAAHDKTGFLEYASGGTLFLDEIGEMPLPVQSKLLRALETREFQRVGSPETRRVDVRLIAATNQNLQDLIARGQFREELYYRLCMVEIRVPRLSDRKEDLPYLTRFFLDRFSSEFGKSFRGITPRAELALVRHSWPGNVRELENVFGHACMMATSEVIDIHDFPESLRAAQMSEDFTDDGQLSLAEVGRRHTHRVLESVGGNKARAARILGINRATLHRLLKEESSHPGTTPPPESSRT